jgi:small subunit ribosomal protein S1
MPPMYKPIAQQNEGEWQFQDATEALKLRFPKGSTVTGTVVRVAQHVVDVDLGECLGRIHKYDLAWNPEEALTARYKEGQPVAAMVLQARAVEPRLSLGVKQLSADPLLLSRLRLLVGHSADGTVLSLSSGGAFVELDEGVTGFIPSGELTWSATRHAGERLRVGEVVRLLVQGIDDLSYRIRLSIRALTPDPWNGTDFPITLGTVVTGVVRGVDGANVQFVLADGMLAVAQIASSVKDAAAKPRIGQQVQARVTGLDNEKRRLHAEFHGQPTRFESAFVPDLSSRFRPGETVAGIVRQIFDSGLILDCDGTLGFVPKTQVARRRLIHPADAVSLGEVVHALVQTSSSLTGEVTLSMKALVPPPWEASPENFPGGLQVLGRVIAVPEAGALVEIFDGVEAYLRLYEVFWSRKSLPLQDFLKPGDILPMFLLPVAPLAQRLELSLKRVGESPWSALEEKHPVGSRLTGTVRTVVDYGVFICVPAGVDGLLHISDIITVEPMTHPSEYFSEDQQVEVTVLRIDADAQRLGLGFRQNRLFTLPFGNA